jgi:hypothetical protein
MAATRMYFNLGVMFVLSAGDGGVPTAFSIVGFPRNGLHPSD